MKGVNRIKNTKLCFDKVSIARRRNYGGGAVGAVGTVGGDGNNGGVRISFLLSVTIGFVLVMRMMPAVFAVAIPVSSTPPLSASVSAPTSFPSSTQYTPLTIPDGPLNCSRVQSQFQIRGISVNDIPKGPVNEIGLKYCDNPPSGTCCTYHIEARLAGTSRAQLEKNTRDSIQKLASILATRATKFNDFFKDLLKQSQEEFHDMFKRTYGVIYEQNAYVFSNLFTELESYYLRGKVDLDDAMDSFFNTLYQKMFTVLNSQYKFSDKYLLCVSEHMKELKPFGDVPDKLSSQIKRSFVATRTYEQALQSAADVAKNMISVRPSNDCQNALIRMQQCSLCKGYVEKPCSNYCVNVMKGCLQQYNEIDAEWDNFVVAMERISERLIGPFNIVMVVEPINIKISEAIMNFQETGQDISQQIFQGCGRPQLGRRRRSSDDFLNNNYGQTKNFNGYINESGDDGLIFDDSDENAVNGSQVIDTSANNDNNNNNNNNNNYYFNDIDNNNNNNDDNNRNINNFNYNNNMKNRLKRDTESTNRELQYEPLHFPNKDEEFDSKNKKKSKKKSNENTNNNSGSHEDAVLEKLVKEIRQKVKDSKKFWSNLPYQVCNSEEFVAGPNVEEKCWNGKEIERYPHSITTDNLHNPEFSALVSAPPKQSTVISAQLYALKSTNTHLKNAYNGNDVEWTDINDDSSDFDGSGSGSGAGYDDEDFGSGAGPYDINRRIDHTDLNAGIHSKPDVNSASTSKTTNGTHQYGMGVGSGSTGGGSGASSGSGSGKNDKPSAGGGAGATTFNKIPEILIIHVILIYLLPISVTWFRNNFCDFL